MRVLMPLPAEGFDPTEAAVPWKVLSDSGVEIVFATQSGAKPSCDLRMLTGQDLGWLGFLLKANALGRQAYLEMSESPAFLNPIQWNEIASSQFDALLLPGGHAQGMKEYLESRKLQKTLVEFVTEKKPVGAICHGVVLAARSLMPVGQETVIASPVNLLKCSKLLSSHVQPDPILVERLVE